MIAPSTRWAVRSALEFCRQPRTAFGLARQLEESVRDVLEALNALAADGEIRYLDHGRFMAEPG